MAAKPVKKVVKLPAGERPKQLSKGAATIKKAAATPAPYSKRKPEKITAGEAARRNNVEKDRMARKTNISVFNQKASTSYSPKPMSAFAKEKAAMRGAETQGKTGKLSPAQKKMFKELPREGSRKPKAGSSTASKVVKRAKTVAREAGDVKKAVKNVAKSGAAALNPSYSGIRNLGKEAVKATGKDLKKQLKEVGSALVSGKPGSRTRNISYNPDTGTPEGVKTVRPKYGAFPGKSYKTGKKK